MAALLGGVLVHCGGQQALSIPGVTYTLQTIREVQPDVVVVELCQYRVSMLKMDERTLLREAKEVSLEKLQQAVRQVRTWASQVCMGP